MRALPTAWCSLLIDKMFRMSYFYNNLFVSLSCHIHAQRKSYSFTLSWSSQLLCPRSPSPSLTWLLSRRRGKKGKRYSVSACVSRLWHSSNQFTTDSWCPLALTSPVELLRSAARPGRAAAHPPTESWRATVCSNLSAVKPQLDRLDCATWRLSHSNLLYLFTFIPHTIFV